MAFMPDYIYCMAQCPFYIPIEYGNVACPDTVCVLTSAVDVGYGIFQ